MKLLTIEIILAIIGNLLHIFASPHYYVLAFTCMWVLAPLCFIILTGICYNIPILGWIGAKIEGGRKLTVLELDYSFNPDYVFINTYNENRYYLKVLHSYKKRGVYKTYVKAYSRTSYWIKHK